jgi:arylsulfatase A
MAAIHWRCKLVSTLGVAGLCLAQAASAVILQASATNPPPRPNIVLILADDLGYGDLSCQNPDSKIRTPNLDRLATQGMRFTDAHAASALCTPSRYSLLTGQYCWRSRLKSGVLNMWDEPLIAPERLTVAGMLRSRGYRTACFGKWHLGLSWPFAGPVPSGFNTEVMPEDLQWNRRIGGGPVDCGFDYYYGINTAYEPPYVFIENDRVVKVPTVRYTSVKGQQGHRAGPGVAGWNWTETLPNISSNTVRWIETNAKGDSHPFFLYASLVGPHQPVLPSARFRGTSQAGVYGDYVQEIDGAVGDLLAALDRTGASTNTLVIFTSDNGPDEFAYARIQQYGHASMGPLRGIKSDIWEGGHRVPFIVRWPGVITSGRTNGQTLCLVDLMRTAADIVGVALPSDAAEDSVSFLPTLLGNVTKPASQRALVLESGIGQYGLRLNNWMYIDSATGDGHNPELEPSWFEQRGKNAAAMPAPALLYDLSHDLGERGNLLDLEPAITTQLQSVLRNTRASTTWIGKYSSDWSASQNWFPQVKLSGADVVYSNLVGSLSMPQTISQTFSVNSIRVDRSVSGIVRVVGNHGTQLILANGIDLNKSGANLEVAVPLILSQSQLWSINKGQALTVEGTVTTDGHALTLSGAGETVIANVIQGSGKLKIRSSGTTVLTATNTFSGGTELSGGGELIVANNAGLGAGPLTIPNHSTLRLVPGVTLTNAAAIQGFGLRSNAAVWGAITLRTAGRASYNGRITLTGNTGFCAEAPGSVLSIGGSMTGTGNLVILPGAGILVFQNNQFYSGNSIIESRLILAGGPDPLPVGTEVIFANSSMAELDLNDSNQTVAAIRGGGSAGGNIVLGRGSLRIGPTKNAVYAGSISGSGGLEKFGPATLFLNGLNAYTGVTKVKEGKLVIDGKLINTSVIVQGGTLSGHGSIAGPVTVAEGGILDLAQATNILTITSQLALTPGSYTELPLDTAYGNNARIQGLVSITYAGTLKVPNLSPSRAITNGQSFHLFSSVFGNGSFDAIEPSPAPGLAWHFEPGNGVLTAIVRPMLSAAQTSPKSATFSWPGKGFHLQVLTNEAGLFGPGKWFDYAGGATNPVMLPIDPGQTNVFFRLVSP